MTIRIARPGAGTSCAAFVLAAAVGAGAQTTSQAPSQAPVQGSTQGTTSREAPAPRVQTERSITLTGCVQRETDYRKAAGDGRGGVGGTGAGTANEFVLTRAATSASPSSAAAIVSENRPPDPEQKRTSGDAHDAVGTTGVASSVYSLTGSRESELEPHVGHIVEITGTLERIGAAEPVASSGRLNATPPPQAGASQKFDELPRVSVNAFRVAGGECR